MKAGDRGKVRELNLSRQRFEERESRGEDAYKGARGVGRKE